MHTPWPWLRQTDDGAGRHRETVVCVNRSEDRADLLVVFDDPHAPLATTLPPERRILFMTEPPEVKVYPPVYLRHFGLVVSPYKPWKYDGKLLIGQPCLNWRFGVNLDSTCATCDLAAMRAMIPAKKTRAVSVVCSSKTLTRQQRRRLAFLDALKSSLGERVIHFGRGFAEIDDKAQAILPFKYHIVLENNIIPHFWTEKLADAYLGFAMPLFSGCPNVAEYFPQDSFVPLDLGDIAAAVERVGDVLERDPYDAALSSILESRRRVLDDYNLYSVLNWLAEGLPPLRRVPQTQVIPSRRWQRGVAKLRHRLTGKA
jgi:hypothetical protein